MKDEVRIECPEAIVFYDSSEIVPIDWRGLEILGRHLHERKVIRVGVPHNYKDCALYFLSKHLLGEDEIKKMRGAYYPITPLMFDQKVLRFEDDCGYVHEVCTEWDDAPTWITRNNG